MSILTWIEEKKRLKVLNAPKHSAGSTDSSKGLWTRCDKCGVILYIKHLKENQRVCFSCSYHLQMMSGERIENLLDKSSANAFPLSKKSAFRDDSLLDFRSPSNKSTICTKGDLKFSASHFRGSKANPLSFSGEDLSVRDKERGFCEAKPKKASNLSTWRPLDETVSPCDPLKFHDQKAYTDRLQDAQERTGLQDAIQTGTGMIDGIPVALAVMDFSFMGGSMGSVVGEKITRLIEYATGEGLTLLIVSASGGARMQEGVFSLMQMAKISSALQIYQSCAKLLYISILTSPTTGGVTASFAMLGDIIFAEPKALIAFAGRRVIEQTLCEDLPDDFQTSEYMLHHGLIDLIVPRRFLRQALSETIRLYQNAPFKKRGYIPFGVQNPITFLTEEKIRRGWGGLTSSGPKVMSSKQYKSTALKRNQGTNVPGFTNQSPKELSESKPLFSESDAFNLMPSSYKSFSQKELDRGSITRLSRNSNEKNEPPKCIYREILTSFEIMLALFLSGNSKKQNQASLRLQQSTHNRFSRNFLSGKIKSPFWLYNNLILRASSTFDNKNFSVDHFKDRTSVPLWKQSLPLSRNVAGSSANKALLCNRNVNDRSESNESNGFVSSYNPTFVTRKQMILGQSRKNEPLYSILKNDFARNMYSSYKSKRALTNLREQSDYKYKSKICKGTDVRARKKVMGSPTFVPAKAKEGSVTQKAAKKKDEVFLQNSRSALKNENGAIPTVEPVREKTFSPQKREPLFSQKSGLSLFKSKEDWSFSTLLGVAFTNKYFFNFSRKGCKALASKRFLISMKLATTYKPLKQKRYDLQKSLLSQKVMGNRFVQKPVSFSTLSLQVSDLSARSGKPLIRSQIIHNRFYVRLKRSFVQRVIFDYGFYCTSVTNLLKNAHSKHSFAGHPAKMQPLREPRNNEGQTSLSSSFLQSEAKLCKKIFKGSNKSLYPAKLSEQNRAGLNGEMPSSSLLYNFRYLAEAILESNRLETSDLQKSPGRTNLRFVSRAEQTQAFYSTQNTVARLNGTVFNRSAIGIKHTKYLRERALSFLQNQNLIDYGLEKKQSPVTQKKNNKVSAISALSSGINKNQKDITSKKVSVTDFTSVENDIDFLNQAIELAATESVEWRSFYIHQQFSENKGFLDDFLQSEGITDKGTQEQTSISTNLKSRFRPFLTQPSDSVNQVGNVLFYKILCR